MEFANKIVSAFLITYESVNCDVMVTIIGNGHSDTSSNPE